MTDAANDYDVLIIGGGPSGSTAALVLARAGVRVAVIERAAFPRFMIGESFLPANYDLMCELGLRDRIERAPHMRKLGAEFVFGHDERDGTRFRFNFSLRGGENRTLNIARADFDQILLDAAVEAGAELLQPASVRKILRLGDGDVAVALDDGRTLSGRYLFDASGQATFVARHLGLRKPLEDKHLRKVAYFEHFTGVKRLDGDMEGFPTVVMCDEGWFWLIPLDETRTSVGLVLDPDVARSVDRPADRMLDWGMQRCPVMRDRMVDAQGPDTNRVCADFSYRCEPFAGPGYFLLGDAAAFLDPVFSSGVCLGMVAGVEAAQQVAAVLQSGRTPETARRRYIRAVDLPMRYFTRVIRHYYNHHFREMFLHGKGPVGVHRAALDILAGHVFPKPRFAVRWRFKVLEMFLALQRRVPLVPRRRHFSLLEQGERSEMSAPHAMAAT